MSLNHIGAFALFPAGVDLQPLSAAEQQHLRDLDPLTAPDWVELEFRKLERAVYRRECEHVEWVDVSAHGGPREMLCTRCGLTVPA